MRHILYVEDSLAMGAVVQAYFDSFENFSVQIAETAEIGLKILSQQAFDLVLMDIHLPGMDGVSLTKHIKAQCDSQHIPIVAVTSDDSHQDLEVNGNKLFDGYINKPVDLSKLIDQVKQYL